MKEMIYVTPTYDVVIEYPDYLEFVMNFILKRVRLTVDKDESEIKWNKTSAIIFDEALKKERE